MQQLRITTLLAAIVGCALHAGVQPATAREIPSDVKYSAIQRVDNGLCPGIVIGIVDARGTSYYSYGKLSETHDRRPDENTIFEIGSITKVFTTTLLAQMVIDGKVKLDDPIETYLPKKVKVPTRGGKKITLLDLATHRSGLPRMPSNFDPADPSNPYADYTDELMYAFLADCELTRDIGEKYEYSNFGMGLLGHLVSRIAGQPYETLIVERICNRLNMNDTRITLSADQRKRLAPGHAGGKKVPNWDLGALAGAGALRSSAKDMLAFLAAHLGLPQTDLSAAMERTRKPRFETGDPNMHISLGWHVSTKFGPEGIWHNGGTGGYRSFCGFDPKKRIGVVVLTNSTHDIDDLGAHVLAPAYPLVKIRKSIATDTSVLDDYVGYYELQPGRIFHVTQDDDKLFAQLTGQGRLRIFPEAPDQYFYKVVDAQISFERDDQKKVTGLVLHQAGDHAAKKLGPDYKPEPAPKEISIKPETLDRYVGRYELAPGVSFKVTADDGQLKVQLTGQPTFPVFATSQTEFFYKVVDAQLTFVVDKDGQATSLILHQGGLDQTAKRIK